MSNYLAIDHHAINGHDCDGCCISSIKIKIQKHQQLRVSRVDSWWRTIKAKIEC